MPARRQPARRVPLPGEDRTWLAVYDESSCTDEFGRWRSGDCMLKGLYYVFGTDSKTRQRDGSMDAFDVSGRCLGQERWIQGVPVFGSSAPDRREYLNSDTCSFVRTETTRAILHTPNKGVETLPAIVDWPPHPITAGRARLLCGAARLLILRSRSPSLFASDHTCR